MRVLSIRLRAAASRWSGMALFACLVLAGSAALLPAHAGSINLIQNGNFTQTAVTGAGGYLCVNSGNSCTSQLTSWSATCSKGGCSGNLSPSSILVAGTNGSAFNSDYYSPGIYWTGSVTPPSGGNVVAIDGDPNYTSVLSQMVSGLQIGQTYMLQFYQASTEEISFTGPTTEQWSVSLGGGTAQTSTLMNTPAGGSTGWALQTMSFVATSTSELLQFAALGTPAGEPPVDLLGDVSLTQQVAAVPEPASLALLGVGLLGLVIVRKKKALLF